MARRQVTIPENLKSPLKIKRGPSEYNFLVKGFINGSCVMSFGTQEIRSIPFRLVSLDKSHRTGWKFLADSDWNFWPDDEDGELNELYDLFGLDQRDDYPEIKLRGWYDPVRRRGEIEIVEVTKECLDETDFLA